MTTKNYTPCRCGRDDERPLTAEAVFPCALEAPARSLEAPSCPCQGGVYDDAPCCDRESQPIPDAPCCCKASMDEALRILCSTELNELVNFGSFFFLTDALSIGGVLETTLPTEGPADNIASATGTLERFSPCNCDLLEIAGTAYFAVSAGSAVALDTTDSVSVCALRAVAFQLAEADDEADQDAQDRRAIRLLRRAIRCAGGDTNSCGICEAHCDCDSCCCNAGLLTELSRRNLSRQATLTAGRLLLRDVSVLGSVGSVLVLWNETDRRVYLVCVDAVEVLG